MVKRPLSSQTGWKSDAQTLEYLDRAGILVQGCTDKLRLRHCASCRRSVLACLDPGLHRRVLMLDPFPATPGGELVAIGAGLRTFEYLRGKEIYERLPEVVATDPAWFSADRIPVLVEHRCLASEAIRFAINEDLIRIVFPATGARIVCEGDPPF